MTLKEALALPKEEVAVLREDLKRKIEAKKELNAYIAVDEAGEGVPLLIKDNIQVKGWNVTAASKILQGYVAPYDATVIEKIKTAGLAPFGRANMDEFAMGSSTETSFYGKTLNPHDPERVAVPADRPRRWRRVWRLPRWEATRAAPFASPLVFAGLWA